MSAKIIAIIAAIVVLGAAGGGAYYLLTKDPAEPESDYTILDNLDANLKKGLTMKQIGKRSDDGSNSKMEFGMAIDDVVGSVFSVSTTIIMEGGGTSDIKDALTSLALAATGKAIFTTEGENEYSTTTKTVENGITVFHTVGKSGSGLTADVTLKATGLPESYTYISLSGKVSTDFTEEKEDGSTVKTVTHSKVKDKDNGMVEGDLSLKVVTTKAMSRDDVKDAFEINIASFDSDYPEDIKTVGEKSKEKFGNVECDKYTLKKDLVDGDDTYRSGTLLEYKGFAVKFSGKAIDSDDESYEESNEFKIYIE